MSEQRLEGFVTAKTATPFNASEQERQCHCDVAEPRQHVLCMYRPTPNVLSCLRQCHYEGATHVAMSDNVWYIYSCHYEENAQHSTS